MTTKTDWTKVAAGTIIHVRDFTDVEWHKREFSEFTPNSNYAFGCKSIDGNGQTLDSLSFWAFAELVEEQPEITPVNSVKFENNHVVVPIVVEHKITQAEYEMIKRVYPDHKVTIIKYIRSLRNLGLVETKKICDTICGLN